MEIRRTANAGILLKLDGITILLDGVCREVRPYPATPPEIKAQLMEEIPQIVAFTHSHKDHYDPGFAAHVIGKNGVILGPNDCHGTIKSTMIEGVKITPVPTRHIGVAGKTTAHTSFVIEGSKCVWFTGDASPSQWRQISAPKPDVLVVPYAYCNTASAWKMTCEFGAQYIVLVHMPYPTDDDIGLWDSVVASVENSSSLYIPDMNENLII